DSGKTNRESLVAEEAHGVRRDHHSASTTSERQSEGEEQHQPVGHDKAPPRRAGLPDRIGPSLSFVANSAKADQQAHCILAQPAEKARPTCPTEIYRPSLRSSRSTRLRDAPAFFTALFTLAFECPVFFASYRTS